jgi:hypothetical protein
VVIDAARLIPETRVRALAAASPIAELRAEEPINMSNRIAPRIEDAPGLTWRARRGSWDAIWRARADLVRRGHRPKNQRLWNGLEPGELDKRWIIDRCKVLQGDMIVWSKGGIPDAVTGFTGTLRSLIGCYQHDKDSSFHKLRYRTKENHTGILKRLAKAHGDMQLHEIKARLLLAWHSDWMEGGRVSMAHSFIAQLRTLFGFGATILENAECERLCAVLHKMRFQMPKPRQERLTAEQAIAVRTKAHEMGWPSIALGQAFQFELMLRQMDVIGEWVPMSEKSASEILGKMSSEGQKWIRGLRWSEIDDNLILRHTTSKRQKDIEVDLKLAPMVMEELALLGERPKSGPVIVSEYNGLPFTTWEYRRRWRAIATAAGLPKAVRNMDSRAGGISEATDAGASLELVRHAATHSNVSTTANYSRGSVEKIADVMKLRSASRNKKGT